MTWSLEAAKHDPASQIRWETIPYFHGRVLDIGCGRFKCFPHWIGVDEGDLPWNVKAKPTDLSLFATQSCDAVFSAHLLQRLDYESVPAVLREWCRTIRTGGHLMLYLPDAAQVKKQEGWQWDCTLDAVLAAMQGVSGWDLIDYQVRAVDDEFSMFFVFRIAAAGEREQSWKAPKPAKTCAVVRYGAIGDMVQMSSILPWLKDEGYHITVYCQDGAGYEVIRSDPHVDRFIVQGKDEVPPQFLEEFWTYTKKKYHKWVNLCESVECTLLASPGRVQFDWPNHVRAKYLNRNYLEWTHELAGVPPPYHPKFHSTATEREKARWLARKWGRKNILWSLSGSSGHKVWPHVDAVIARIMLAWPDVHVVLVGDDFCKVLEVGWEKEPRVHCKSGEWSIRETLAFCEVADVVVGTETGVLNAAGHMDCVKIIMLSHSSEEMLTKHWRRTVALNQPKGVGCAKHPCRQLHGGGNADPWLDCPQEKVTGTALCQYSIDPDMVWGAVLASVGVPERMVA